VTDCSSGKSRLPVRGSSLKAVSKFSLLHDQMNLSGLSSCMATPFRGSLAQRSLIPRCSGHCCLLLEFADASLSCRLVQLFKMSRRCSWGQLFESRLDGLLHAESPFERWLRRNAIAVRRFESPGPPKPVELASVCNAGCTDGLFSVAGPGDDSSGLAGREHGSLPAGR